MRKLSLLIGVVVLMTSSANSQLNQAEDNLSSLVAAERNFSHLSQSDGMREAFLSCLSDDAIVFRPKPINGKQYYRQRPDHPGVLSWQPVTGDISSGGNFGYTTGPYQFAAKPGVEPSLFGDYVSIWRRDPGGEWHVVVDLGISHDRPANEDTTFTPFKNASGDYKPSSPIDVESLRKDLTTQDEELSKVASRDGIGDAVRRFAADGIRMYRERSMPIIGVPAVDSAFTARNGIYRWLPSQAEVSSSADLGYTYGTMEIRLSADDESPGQLSSYLHIWRRGSDGNWRLVLDITNELPDEETGQG
jgi:ketosteroid isomerase-like protein